MANKKISELNINSSPSTSTTLVGVDNGETVQIPIGALGSGGSSSGGGASIIEVEDFPSNPSTTSIYRKWQVVKAQIVAYGEIITNGTMNCEIVDNLPETGNVCYTGTAMYAYYQRADGEAYGYVEETLSAQMSVPVGWYPAATLMSALGYTWNGIIDSIDNAQSEGYHILLTKEPHLYHYYNNKTEIEKSKIITSDSLKSDGIASIIYATELPSTPQQAIYVVTQDEVVKVDILNGTTNLSEVNPDAYYVEIVDALPDDANVCTDTSASFTYGYHLTSDNSTKFYVDETLASALSMSAGWYDAGAMLTAFGATYGGIVSSIDEITDESAFYFLITTQPKTRVYVPMPDGTFLELTSGIRTRFNEKSGTVSITEM